MNRSSIDREPQSTFHKISTNKSIDVTNRIVVIVTDDKLVVIVTDDKCGDS